MTGIEKTTTTTTKIGLRMGPSKSNISFLSSLRSTETHRITVASTVTEATPDQTEEDLEIGLTSAS